LKNKANQNKTMTYQIIQRKIKETRSGDFAIVPLGGGMKEPIAPHQGELSAKLTEGVNGAPYGAAR
ncbi:MAG: hypothetical protein ACK5YD_00865, partial [Phenylobacterium sp.]